MMRSIFFLVTVIVGVHCTRIVSHGYFAETEQVDWLERADTVVKTLLPEFPEGKALNLFDNSTSLWKNQLGWHSAYTLKALSHFAKCATTKNKFPKTIAAIDRQIEDAFGRLALTDYRVVGDNKYDDLNFWTSTWSGVYSYNNNSTYFDSAQHLFWDLVLNKTSFRVGKSQAAKDAIWRGEGNDVPCKGGALWDKDSGYINAISTEWLIYNLGTKDLLKGKTSHSFDWAKEVLEWLITSPMLNKDSLFNDGLNPLPATVGTKCTNNQQPTWTYNQGVILSGIVQLAFEEKGQDTNLMISLAVKIAHATISNLTVNGVLHEFGCQRPNDCVGNNEVFKGMFVQHLTNLIVSIEGNNGGKQTDDTKVFRRFLLRNAQSVWKTANANAGEKNAPPFFGLMWEGVKEGGDYLETVSTQASALDLFTMVGCLQNNNAIQQQ